MSDLRDQFATPFGEMLAASIEAAVERHVPDLMVPLDRGSDPFQFALIWAVGLECLSEPGFRAEHSITVPWEMLRDWIRDADLLAGFVGTFDAAGRGAGKFDEILGRRTEADRKAGWDPAIDWVLVSRAPAA